MILFMSVYILYAIAGLTKYTHNDNICISLSKRKKIHCKLELLITAVCFFHLFLICALRSPIIGTDTMDYIESFTNLNILNRSVAGGSKFEPGYKVLVNLIRVFTNNEQMYIFIVTIIIFVGMYLFVKNNCYNNYLLATIIFISLLYYTTFSAIRQSLALAISINGVYFLRKRMPWKATILILLGGSFHFTSLVLLVLVPLSLTKWNNKKILMTIFGAFIGVFAFEKIINVVLQFFPIYRRYWNSNQMMSERSNVGLFAILVILLCGYSIFSLLTGKLNFSNEEEKNSYILAVVGAILTIFINILGRKYGIFSRISRYFIPFVMLLSTYVYQYSVKNKGKIIFHFLVVTLMGGYYYIIMKGDLYQLIPYVFFWN